jgi:hypothetical protein
MTTTVGVKLPLVRATRAAREQAAAVLPADVILENVVTAAIRAAVVGRAARTTTYGFTSVTA